MTTTPVRTAPIVPAEASIHASTRTRRRKHRTRVVASQIGLLIVLLGGWQLAVGSDQLKIVLYGEPTGILDQLVTWFRDGTAIGPPCGSRSL
jgi:NitT/TauT family transport system permease protein